MSLREARATFSDPFRTPVSALVHAAPGEHVSRRGLSRLARGVSRALDFLLDVAGRTLSARAAVAAFRHEGFRRVRAIEDVARLELWEVDETAERLLSRYVLAALALGASTGSLGGAGLVLDVPAAGLLAARAIGDVALHYGFDPRAPEERRFTRDVLVAALTPAPSVRKASLDELVAAGIAGARAWRRRDTAFGAPMLLRLVRRVFRAGLSRDQRESLVRTASVGAAIANAWLLLGVLRAARSAYRERFLARRSLARRPPHDEARGALHDPLAPSESPRNVASRFP